MLTKTALVLSGLLVLAWGVLMLLVEPASDPNAVLEYIDLTVSLVAVLALVWIVVLLVSLGRRLANRR